MLWKYAAIIMIAVLSGCASTGDWSSDTPTKTNARASKAPRVNLNNQSVSKVYAPSSNLWLRIRDGYQMEPMNSPVLLGLDAFALGAPTLMLILVGGAYSRTNCEYVHASNERRHGTR